MERITPRQRAALALLFSGLFSAPLGGCGEPAPPELPTGPGSAPVLVDPGSGPWELVPAEQVAEVCQLDPALLNAADGILQRPWAVVRHGRLCHEYYPSGNPDAMTAAWSATKTLGAVTMGMVAYRTRELPRTGRHTGPLSDLDRVDQWLDSFSFNKDAQVAHVLAMVAQNKSLAYGSKRFSYDALGTAQINRLSDIMNTAIAQDSQRLSGNVEGFVQRYLFGPLGMHHSVWNDGKPDKVLAYSWMTTVRDMAKLGLLLLHRGRWAGEVLLSEDWVYRMSHPSFEDASAGYGYLTWLNASSNSTDLVGTKQQGPDDPCAPVALYPRYPHEPSGAPDCGYSPPYTCAQQQDVGIFWASGLGGQKIVVHRALDMVLIIKDFDHSEKDFWSAVRPALLALDPTYHGDDKAFCAAYGGGSYAPDLPPTAPTN